VKLQTADQFVRSTDLLRELTRCMGRSDGSSFRDASVLGYTLLVELSRHIPSVHLLPSVRKAMAFIDENLGRFLSSSAIARRADLSVSQCQRQFRAHFGLSPVRYFMRRKMEYAKILLADTGKRIKEVASELGYEDQLLFSKQFRRVAAMSPRAYREMIDKKFVERREESS
jgi:AraC-like DNA-binding protein